MEQRFHACKTSQNNGTTKADATIGDFARGYWGTQHLWKGRTGIVAAVPYSLFPNP
jgi:hypothetical protein